MELRQQVERIQSKLKVLQKFNEGTIFEKDFQEIDHQLMLVQKSLEQIEYAVKLDEEERGKRILEAFRSINKLRRLFVDLYADHPVMAKHESG